MDKLHFGKKEKWTDSLKQKIKENIPEILPNRK